MVPVGRPQRTREREGRPGPRCFGKDDWRLGSKTRGTKYIQSPWLGPGVAQVVHVMGSGWGGGGGTGRVPVPFSVHGPGSGGGTGWECIAHIPLRKIDLCTRAVSLVSLLFGNECLPTHLPAPRGLQGGTCEWGRGCSGRNSKEAVTYGLCTHVGAGEGEGWMWSLWYPGRGEAGPWSLAVDDAGSMCWGPLEAFGLVAQHLDSSPAGCLRASHPAAITRGRLVVWARWV